MLIYVDTSALLAFTLAKRMEPARFQATSSLFDLIQGSAIKAVTSFYALHELLVVAMINTSPDWEAGSNLARKALTTILNTRLLYVPIPGREEKIRNARLFSALQDATDLPHAIAAHTVGCTAIVGYDEHFRAISGLINYKTPEEIVAAVQPG